MPKPPHGLRSFFQPRSIAVAGVSTDPGKLGSIIFTNLMENRASGLLTAAVYALNPSHDHIGNERAYPSIDALPQVPELLIVAVPEALTEELAASAADAGVGACIIVTSGYAEVGKRAIEDRMAKLAAKSGMRILGPNTIGVVDTLSGVDSLFLRPTKQLPDGRVVPSLLRPLKGKIVVITQSGHLGQAIVEELAANGVGIRALVGTGNQVDVSVEDVMEYFADDPETGVIAIYVEGLRDGKKFMEVARRASANKPIVALKVGKTGSGARAALTHTASMVGDYDVYRAAFRQAGVIEARSFQELVDYSIALSMLPPGGNRLAIVTNAGGVGALAADEAHRAGLLVEPVAPGAVQKMRKEFRESRFMANASLANPVDLTATAKTEEFVKVVEEVASLPQYDLVLALPTHQTPAIDPGIAEMLVAVARRAKKPVCMCVVGRAELADVLQRLFMESGVPSFPTPERAVRALSATWLRSTPVRRREEAKVRPRKSSWKKGTLSHEDASRLLRRYGIAEPRAALVRSEEDFGKLKKLRFPVACKLVSRDISHKTDVGGVVLSVRSREEAQACFARMKRLSERARFDGMLVQEMVNGGVELILGGRSDPTFGHVVAVGLGGTRVELSGDVSLAVAPASPAELRSMVEGSALEKVLRGYRGGPKASLEGICAVASRFSEMLAENSLSEVEINPLIARGRKFVAVDFRARVS